MLSESLIHIDENQKKWLKFKASSHTLTKCVLGHLKEYKSVKNPSLAASPQVKAIQDLIKAAVSKHDEGETNIFEDDHEQASTSLEKGKPTKKKMLRTAPDTVDVMLGDACVTFKTPSSWKEVILVPLEPGPLTLVCDWIMQDIGNCLSQKRRNYTKSGNFRKQARVDKDDDSSE